MSASRMCSALQGPWGQDRQDTEHRCRKALRSAPPQTRGPSRPAGAGSRARARLWAAPDQAAPARPGAAHAGPAAPVGRGAVSVTTLSTLMGCRKRAASQLLHQAQ